MTNDVLYTLESTVNVNGVTLAWDAFGDPACPAVLFICGLGVQLVGWESEFCEEIAQYGFYVIRFDNRDVGKSTTFDGAGRPSPIDYARGYLGSKPVKSPYTINDMAQDALGLLTALYIERAHVIGMSMGGMIAQQMAINEPDRLITLTSIMSHTGERDLPNAHWSLALPRLMRPFPITKTGKLEHLVAALLAMNGSIHGEAADTLRMQITRGRARAHNPAGKQRQLWAIAGSRGRRLPLKQVNVPALVIHGDEDKLIPVACGVDTAQALPNARLVIIKGLGHCFPRSVWGRVIDEFLKTTKV